MQGFECGLWLFVGLMQGSQFGQYKMNLLKNTPNKR